jgi:glutathione synthase/RimK-type ligase-like ATP-grasp enzyme
LLEIASLRGRRVRLINGPDALVAAHDKLQTARRLGRAGVPHPRTVHVVGLEQIAALEPPFVLKPRFGS